MKHTTKRLAALLLAAVMVFGLLPVTALAAPRRSSRTEGVTIDVTDYGADPTGTKESSTAVIAALEHAETLGDAQKTIVFPKGEYHFYADQSEVRELYVSNTVGTNQDYKNKHLGILVEDLKNVTIEGNGSQFIFHGDMTAFATIRSQNVTFQNFSVDYASPSVIDVTVERYEGTNAAILYVPSCYTYRITNGNSIYWTVEGDQAHSGSNNLGYQQGFDTISGITRRGTGGPFSGVTSIEELGDNRLKVTYSGNRPQVGMCYQLRNTTRTTPGTFFWESDGVTLNNINIQFLHGFGMVGQLSKNITLDTVKFEARPGTGRTSAGFADFIQMSSIGGQVTIRNCDFSNPHDDPINIHGTFLRVTEVSNENKTFKLHYEHNETGGFPQYYVGDEVEFATKGSMAYVADSLRTVVSVVNPGEGGNDLNTITITLNEAVSGITANNYVVENVTYTPNVLIENCRFVETPTRGVLVTTRGKVIIRNNYFDRMGMAAIFISCDANGWYESGRTQDVTIENNVFNINSSNAILVEPTGTGAAGNRVHNNMTIKNNTVYMWGNNQPFNILSVDGLTVEGNTVLRYTPNVSLALTSGSTDLTVGGSQSLSLTANGGSFGTKLYDLRSCENVTIRNNIYDDGLNAGANLNGTAAGEVNVAGEALRVGGDNQLPAVGTVTYFSSDPAVATVDASGVVTGVSAGTAEIYAFRTAAGRTFESNHLTFTVTGEAAAKPGKIQIGGGADAVEVNEASDPFTATVTPNTVTGNVAWAVKPVTEGAAAAITSDGVLTATAPGVVEVTASLGGVTASRLVTVKKPNFDYLSDLEWTRATVGDSAHSEPCKDSSWTSDEMAVTGADGQKVVFAKGIGTHAVSEITYNLAGKGYTRFTAKIGASYAARVKRETNIRFSVLCDNAERYTSGTEAMLETTPYKEVDVDLSGVNTLLLKVVGVNNTWSAHGNWADAKLYSNNQAPTATAVTAAADENDHTVGLTYTYHDTDNDGETGSLIKWYASDTQDGHFVPVDGANTATLAVNAATSEKFVRAVVVPRDATGRFGAPVTSNVVQAPAQAETANDATLSSLSVTGLTLTPAFDPAVTAYTVNAPAAVSAVTVNAAATQKNASVAGTGSVTLTDAATTATVTVTAPDRSTRKEYTLTIHRAQSSNVTLENLTAIAGSESIDYNTNTRFYALSAPKGTESLTFTATPADVGVTVKARFNGEEKGAVTGQQSYPLAAGLNHLELRVTAADGLATALYRVRVLKSASNDATLSSLTVNGTNVELKDGEALARLTSGTATIAAAATDPKASVFISVDGKSVASGDRVTLTKDLTTATVRVVAEDTATERTYTVVLAKQNESSADLYSLKLGKLALSPAFDPNTKSYTATAYGNASVVLEAVATQAGATVTYETVADYKTAENGGVTGQCRFFKDVGVPENGGDPVNTVTVTVTSPDGSATKTYTVAVTVVESAYLSDLEWVSAQSGWRTVQRDLDVDTDNGKRNKLKLLDENLQEVVFDKGLGTHANSTIVYDLSPMGFTTFTSKVGLDHSQASNTTQGLRFFVDVDNVNAYTTNENEALKSTTAWASINVTIPDNASELMLRVQYTYTNDGNAHADWADAKLSTTIPLLANSDISIQHLAFGENETHTIYANEDDANHTVTLEPTIKPVGVGMSAHVRVLNWESSNEDVATVVNGVVTAVAPGEATITATAISGATASCTVTVKWKLAGKVSVSGGPRVGSTLTGALNQLDQGAKGNVDIQWLRKGKNDAAFTEIAGATEKDYTVAADAANVGAEYKVVVTGKANSLYEGTSESDPITMTKLEGEPLKAVPNATHASDAETADGAITGLFKGRAYQYQKVAELGETPVAPAEDAWEDFKDESGDETGSTETYGTAAIGSLYAGTYVVRRAADDLHEAGPHRTVTIDLIGNQNYAVTNPNNFDGNIVQVGRTSIPGGDTVTLTVIPKEGWELVPDSLKAIEDVSQEEHIAQKKDGTENQYTFTMPAAAVTIDAQFRLKTYHIDHQLTHISCDMDEHDHTATHGEQFTITLTPDEGYEMRPTTVTVTNADTDQPFTDYTYLPDETDSAKRVLTFAHGVTCNIAIAGEASLKQYTVVYHLTNGLTAPNAPQTATHTVDLTANLSAARGYALPDSITVEVGGTELTAEQYDYDAESGKIDIPGEQVIGNVVITADGEAQAVPLQTVALVGPARVGRTLRVNTVPVAAADTAGYQWIQVAEDGTETVIEGETGQSYVIRPEDEGKTIKVKVTATGSYEGEITSEPTAAVSERADDLVFVTHIDLDPTEAEVNVGKTLQINATATPENATSKALFWSSDNEAIATVDQNGVVTAVAEGSATITVSATDTIHTDAITYCHVTVTKAETPVNPSRPSGGNGSTTTKTETRDDGSKVTTVTKPDGTVTETVEQLDGSKSETITAKDGAVTITVTDPEGEELAKVELPATIPAPETRFDDVPEGHWADKAIHNAASLELVKGVGNNKFDMVAPMSRGSLATVLHRLSQGKTDYESTFKDVAAGKFYTEGVAWAAKAGVVTGYTEDTFAPEDTITREQLAVMLARYAKLIGMDTKADGKALNQFADGEATGTWAVDGVAWCVENGILQGKGGNVLDPTTNVTRAEVAVMLDRFIALIK